MISAGAMTDYSEQITKALTAHGAWKHRLNQAIAAGTSEFTVVQTQADNRCDFGRWLYSLPADLRSTNLAINIQRLHAAFHAEAARILDLALRGQKQEALKALESSGAYSHTSGQLVLALRQRERQLVAL
jgi:hypothetical protein